MRLESENLWNGADMDLLRIAVVYSIQTWLGESEESRKNATTPGYLNVGMACE